MAPRRPIYLDHHATTPLDPRVLEAMDPWLRDDFGNAASRTHAYGWRARAAVESARERIASALGAAPREIVFTSGATESNNLALLGAARAAGRPGKALRDGIVTVATEHRAVLDPCKALEADGYRVTRLGVDPQGRVDLDALAAAVDARTLLVSVMWANNEIGVIQDLAAVALTCREHGAWLHSDAAQAAGKVAIDVDRVPVDLLSLSFHKLYGPKGIGALYVRSRNPHVRIAPILFGGGHEAGLRPGTLPVALIVGAASALDLAVSEMASEALRLSALRDRLQERLQAELPGVLRNGDPVHCLPGNLNLSFEGAEGERLVTDLEGLAVSTGSACTSEEPGPSHVLAALGRSGPLARASLRFGLGRSTTEAEIETAALRVIEAVCRNRAEGLPAQPVSGH
ncbi:MAG: cysteine desulfurase family protein [Myxococcota bacterium]|jgi:cysteine desulfurase